MQVYTDGRVYRAVIRKDGGVLGRVQVAAATRIDAYLIAFDWLTKRSEVPPWVGSNLSLSDVHSSRSINPDQPLLIVVPEGPRTYHERT